MPLFSLDGKTCDWHLIVVKFYLPVHIKYIARRHEGADMDNKRGTLLTFGLFWTCLFLQSVFCLRTTDISW